MYFQPTLKGFLAMAALTAMITVGAPPTDAAGINDLDTFYGGSAHSTTDTDLEDLSLSLGVLESSPNGKFSGFIAGVNISGKVTANGKMTFSGSGLAESAPAGDPSNGQIKKGKAQVSATGRFIVGSFTFIGSGSLASRSGKYIFSITSDLNTVAVQGSGSASGLADAYSGSAHHSTISVLEDQPFDWATQSSEGNGAYVAVIGTTPVKGKVKPTGALKISGKSSFSGGSVRLNGKAQLSASGTFMIGAIKLKGTGVAAGDSGLSTFEASAQSIGLRRRAGFGATR